MDVERVIVRLVADAGQYNRMMRLAEVRLVDFATRVTGLGAAINIPMLAAAGAVTALGTAMGAAAFESIRLASQFEQIGVALKVMTGDAQTAQDLLSDLTKFSIETPFKIGGVFRGARELRAFGTEVDQILPTLRALGDVASGVNAGSLEQTLARVILAYGQVRTAGRLRGSELRQFTEAGIPLPRELAKVMGVHETSIQGLVQQGKVGFPEVVAAFNRMTQAGGTFFGMMQEQNKTVLGQWTSFTETLQLGMMKVGKSFLDTFGIRDMLTEWRQALAGPDAGKIDEFFVRLRDNVNDVWTVIKAGYAVIRGAVVGLADLVRQGTAWAKSNEDVVKGWLRMTAIIVAAIAIVQTAVFVFGLLTAAVALILSPIGLAVAGVTGLILALEQLGGFDLMGHALLKSFREMGTVFGQAWQGIKDALASNDLPLAADIAFKAIQIAWRSLLLGLRVEWELFKSNLYRNFDILPSEQGIKDFLNRHVAGVDVPDRDRQKMEQYQKELEKWRDDRMAPLKRELDFLLNRARAGSPAGKEEEFQRFWKAEQDKITFFEGRFKKKLVEPLVDKFEESFIDMMGIGKGNIAAFGGLGEAGLLGILKGRRARIAEYRKGLEAAVGLQFMFFRPGAMFGASTPEFRERFAEQIAQAAGGPGAPPGIRAPLQVSPQALTAYHDVQKAMESGRGNLDRFTHMQNQMLLMEEAFLGPASGRGPGAAMIPGLLGAGGGLGLAAVGKTVGPMTAAEYEYGIFEAFEKARHGLQRADRLPPTAFRGTQEAQEAINRANQETLSTAEQVRQDVEAIRRDEEASREYMRQVVEELKRIRNEEYPMFGSGGDF